MIRYIDEVYNSSFRGKTCIVRIDLNETEGNEQNSFRLQQVLPTLRFLLEHDMRVVIMSHRGRFSEDSPSLKPFSSILSQELGVSVAFASHAQFSDRGDKKVVLLDNLRLHREEQENDVHFSKQLASFGDFYVNDAFSVSHRAHASIVGITKYIPSYGGLLLRDELQHITEVTKKPRHPFVVLIGGAKISDKLGVIEHLWEMVDWFLLGGGPANTVHVARGGEVGSSLIDEEALDAVQPFIDAEKLIAPDDFEIEDGAYRDIGKQTIVRYQEVLRTAKTIVWSGPMGMFEKDRFAGGTRAMWESILENKEARTVVGGGETLASINLVTDYQSLAAMNKNVFLSTGGGAMLKLLAGETLPGLDALHYNKL
ncbi:MAG TPA: phosphoglycerate kinase [Candidatus Jorgensenbacteria bacterium]|nr:phosphoglycerate kinase [Candidatus Jorgensenbacteria bacterium]